MGEYADMEIERGFDELCDDGYDGDDMFIHRGQPRRSVFYTYSIHQIEAETEKAVLVRFKNDNSKNEKYFGKPWIVSFWFPKSQVDIDKEDMKITVPEWLINIQFEAQFDKAAKQKEQPNDR